MTPAVSIIMSVHNGQPYLVDAMESLLNQTFADFELIVVNDGSTDQTGLLLACYAARDKRVRVIRQANAGLTASLNTAARAARAPLLARMDPDDIADLTRLEKQVAHLDANPEITLLGTRVTLIDPYGTPYRHPKHALSHDEIDARLLHGEGWSIVHPTAVMRREAFERVGGYDERFRTSQDFDLWLRMAETGRLENLEEPLLQYRQHLASANFAKADEQKRLKTIILDEAYRRRGLPAIDPAAITPAPSANPFETRRRWGWAAIAAQRFAVARKHAIANLKTRPASAEMWKLLGCSVRDEWRAGRHVA